MANCSRCNVPLSLSERFTGINGVCKKCEIEIKSEEKSQIEGIKSSIISSKQISENNLLLLKKYKKTSRLSSTIQYYPNSILIVS